MTGPRRWPAENMRSSPWCPLAAVARGSPRRLMPSPVRSHDGGTRPRRSTPCHTLTRTQTALVTRVEPSDAPSSGLRAISPPSTLRTALPVPLERANLRQRRVSVIANSADGRIDVFLRLHREIRRYSRARKFEVSPPGPGHRPSEANLTQRHPEVRFPKKRQDKKKKGNPCNILGCATSVTPLAPASLTGQTRSARIRFRLERPPGQTRIIRR